jgi:hypothetical protein
MKVVHLLATLIFILDAFLGIRFFLNVIHVLETTKYGPRATLLYACFFLLLAALGFYFLFIKHNMKWALVSSFGPWIIILCFILFSMLTSNPQ